ncbi:MAG: hypothetical protein NVSMB4_21230 [Acidimicrobiales bacterium]
MTITCASCARPTDMYLCTSCADSLRSDLQSVPWLCDELETTLTRQGRMSHSVGGSSKGRERPLPFDSRASEVAWLLHNVLSTTALDLCETRGITYPGVDASPAIASWLARNVAAIRLEESAEQIMDEVTDAVAQCRRVIDTPRGRVFAGPCGEEGDKGRCGADLYASPGKPTVVCGECGAEHDVELRRVWLLEQARGYMGTAATLAALLPWFLGEPITRKRITYYGVKGMPKYEVDGETHYKVGDVVDAHHERLGRAA